MLDLFVSLGDLYRSTMNNSTIYLNPYMPPMKQSKLNKEKYDHKRGGD
jgi:hypothetical protein